MDSNELEQCAEMVVSAMQKLAFSFGKFDEEQDLVDDDWLTDDEMITIENKLLISNYKYAEQQLLLAIKQNNLNGVNYMGIVFHIVDGELNKLFNVFPIEIYD